MNVPADTLATLAVAVLTGGILTTILTWVKDRKKDAATVEVTSVSALTEALAALRIELVETRHEVERLREENAELTTQIRALEAHIDELRRNG